MLLTEVEGVPDIRRDKAGWWVLDPEDFRAHIYLFFIFLLRIFFSLLKVASRHSLVYHLHLYKLPLSGDRVIYRRDYFKAAEKVNV